MRAASVKLATNDGMHGLGLAEEASQGELLLELLKGPGNQASSAMLVDASQAYINNRHSGTTGPAVLVFETLRAMLHGQTHVRGRVCCFLYLAQTSHPVKLLIRFHDLVPFWK